MKGLKNQGRKKRIKEARKERMNQVMKIGCTMGEREKTIVSEVGYEKARKTRERKGLIDWEF